MCLEEAPLLRRDQYANYAKRYSISSSEAKSRDLCRARMRRNEQAEKQKHGIAYDTSSPLGEEARRRRRIDVPRRGTLLRSGQYGNCAKRYSVSSFRAKREIFVIRGLAVSDWKFQTGNLLSTYLRASPHILQRSCHHNPEPSSLFENAP